MLNKTYVITAAGGNGTAIRILDKPLSRAEYAEQGKQLGQEMEKFGAEQAGFLIDSISIPHFEMAGGEFCGNAARSVAILISRIQERQSVSFTMSGFAGVVRAFVRELSSSDYFVECVFPELPTKTEKIDLEDGKQATIVDLGGIVHVVIEGDFPENPEEYKAKHRNFVHDLSLGNRDAVGVIWFKMAGNSVRMHPVVWVKEIDTFFYEKACGSGTIAVAKVTGINIVIQPTGQTIEALIGKNSVTLRSEMEVVNESD